jgi:Rrf2 family protein
VVTLRAIAQALGESPSYIAKIARHLVRAGILRAQRGQAGGVVLGAGAADVTFLAVVVACQGALHGTFCQHTEALPKTCALHQAAAELHLATVGVLSRWTLADFCRRPCPDQDLEGTVACLMQGRRFARRPPAGGPQR